MSIYADPILAVLISCLAKIIFFNKFDKNNIILLFILIAAIYFTHRLGILLLISFLPYIFFRNFNYFISYKNFGLLFIVFVLTYFNFWFSYNLTKIIICLSILHLIVCNDIFSLKIKKENIISFLILILTSFKFFFFDTLSYSATPVTIFNEKYIFIDIFISYFLDFKNLIYSPIYFSSFGITFNKLFELIFGQKNLIDIFKLNILFWVLIILVFLTIKRKFTIFMYFLITFLIYLFLIYIEKIYLQKLSYLAIGRYVSILIIPYLMFIIFEKKNNFILLLLIVLNFSITPLKSFGFLAPDNIYYNYESNYQFLKTRKNIKNFVSADNQCESKNIIIFYDKDNFPDFLNGHHSLVLNIIKFEYFNYKILYFDINEIKSFDTIDFVNIFDCIYSINLSNKDYKNLNYFSKSIKKLEI